MDADNSFYVKFIATYAPTFFGYIISVLAMVGVPRGISVNSIPTGGRGGGDSSQNIHNGTPYFLPSAVLASDAIVAENHGILFWA